VDGPLSAPPSPSAQPQMSSPDSYYNREQANALQHHFEQISMVCLCHYHLMMIRDFSLHPHPLTSRIRSYSNLPVK
jgi:hypothetical protein